MRNAGERCRGPVKSDVLFDIRQNVSPDLVALVRRAIRQAREYFAYRTTDCEPFGTSVQITDEGRGPWAATVYNGNIYIRGGDGVWTLAPVERRYALLFHEWYHLVQEELLRSRRTGIPDWLAEGTAEWIGYRAAVHFGYYPSYAYVRSQERAEALATGVPLERLTRRVEVGPQYALSFMAIDELDLHERALLRFWRILGAGERWRDAFDAIFGVSVPRFYERFERARRAGFP